MAAGWVSGLVASCLLVASLAGEARADARRVCAFSFHGPEEIEAFRAHLTPELEFVDLSPPPLLRDPASSSTVNDLPRDWLPGVCRPDLRCDVVVFSAEFAGRFFGDYGRALSLQAMEEAACQARCDGLFHAPREVFLLACNTLATKDQDLRGPELYLQVLLNHGFDRAAAERVVAMRYGPLGPTFREALRRIFAGVPKLYGFSSVAPRGEYTAPMLDRYFRKVGDYRAHLERMTGDSRPNRALAAAFAHTGLVETTGLRASEPGAVDRELICTLYDESVPVARRLEIVRDLVAGDDVLAFVPTVKVFVDRHPPEKMSIEERAIFDEIRRNETARERVVALVDQLDVSALQLELGDFATRMGWLSPERLRKLALHSARELLRRPLTNEVVDVMCEIPKHERVGDEFTSADLPDALFRDPVGVRLVTCLAPPGDEVSARLAAALGDPDPEVRLWAAYALSQRLPLSSTVLLRVVERLGDPSPEVRRHLEWILAAQRPLPRDVRRVLEARGRGARPKG